MDKTNHVGAVGEGEGSVELNPNFSKSSQSIRLKTVLKFHQIKCILQYTFTWTVSARYLSNLLSLDTPVFKNIYYTLENNSASNTVYTKRIVVKYIPG